MSPRSSRPLVGVTGPDQGGAAAWWFTRFALWRAGARARRITPSRPSGTEDLDGLVLGGGADVDPRLYGSQPPSALEALEEEPGRERRWGGRLVSIVALLLRRGAARKRSSPRGDSKRDELELDLLDRASKSGKPILGICRGAQLLNVHFGGTLHQELSSFYEETPQITTVRPRKTIELEAGSLLERILRTRRCRVNALHEQAVARVAEDLRVGARERTGVIQAIEHPERPFVLGVQWHPEYLPQIRRQRRIFERLVRVAREGMTPGVTRSLHR